MNSGVYSIINFDLKKVYIGSTKDFDERQKSHITNLKLNQHPNYKLQEDFNKGYTLTFLIEHKCSIEEMKQIEQKTIEYYKNNTTMELYNLYPAKFENWDDEHSKNYSGKNNYQYKNLEEQKVICNMHDGNNTKRHSATKNPNSKLTINKCLEIKKLLIDGISCQRIAERFNVSSSIIKDIRRGNYWSNKELGGNLADWEVDMHGN